MRRFKDHPLVGRWRVVKADLWNAEHLDLCGPAMIVIRADGTGEVNFGAMADSLDIACSHDDIGFNWSGCEGHNQVQGAGDTQPHKDASLLINFAYRNGEEFVLNAQREGSSTAC